MRGFPLAAGFTPPPPLAVSSPPTRRSPLEGGGRGRRKPVEPPLCTSKLYPGQRAIALFDGRKTEDKFREQRNRTFFPPPFQLNTHRYSAPRSVSAIRARVQEEPSSPIKINLCLGFATMCTIIIQNSRLASNAICILICERIAHQQ